jgi:hypothetical protein
MNNAKSPARRRGLWNSGSGQITRETGNRAGLIRPDFRALFAGASHGFFHSSDLTSENEPAFSRSEKAPLMSRLTLRLRNLLFGVRSALATRKHVLGSPSSDLASLPSWHRVCAILIIWTRPPTAAAQMQEPRHSGL